MLGQTDELFAIGFGCFATDGEVAPDGGVGDPGNADQGSGQEDGEESSGDKATKEMADLQALVQKQQEDIKSLTDETINRKKKLREMETEQKGKEEALQIEQGKYKDLYESKSKEIEFLTEQNRATAVKAAMEPYAVQLGIHDLDALKLADKSKVLYDEDSNMVHGFKEAIDLLKKNKPFLFKSDKVPPTQTPTDGPGFEKSTGEVKWEDMKNWPLEKRKAYFQKKGREDREAKKSSNGMRIFTE